MSAKKNITAKKIGYWAATGLTGVAFLAGGAMDVARGPAAAGIMAHLGYPLYFAVILGAWKILGALAILAPGLPRVKEWAYAGIMFDLSGAALSHAAVSDPLSNIATPLFLLALAAVSWALRPHGRILPGATMAGAPESSPLRASGVTTTAAPVRQLG